MRILAISVLILGLDWFGWVCCDNVIAGFASRASAATRGVVIAMGGGNGTPGQVTFYDVTIESGVHKCRAGIVMLSVRRPGGHHESETVGYAGHFLALVGAVPGVLAHPSTRRRFRSA